MSSTAALGIISPAMSFDTDGIGTHVPQSLGQLNITVNVVDRAHRVDHCPLSMAACFLGGTDGALQVAGGRLRHRRCG